MLCGPRSATNLRSRGHAQQLGEHSAAARCHVLSCAQYAGKSVLGDRRCLLWGGGWQHRTGGPTRNGSLLAATRRACEARYCRRANSSSARGRAPALATMLCAPYELRKKPPCAAAWCAGSSAGAGWKALQQDRAVGVGGAAAARSEARRGDSAGAALAGVADSHHPSFPPVPSRFCLLREPPHCFAARSVLLLPVEQQRAKEEGAQT